MACNSLKKTTGSKENYLSLKKPGSIGDSLIDVVTEIQEEIEGNKKLLPCGLDDQGCP
jgi:hypothetical protein